jgi:hypothetical protein
LIFSEKLSIEERKSIYDAMDYYQELEAKLDEAMTKLDAVAQRSIIGIVTYFLFYCYW